MAVKAERPRHPDDLEDLLVHQPGDRKAQQGDMLHRRPVRDGLEPRPLPVKGRRKREARSITHGQHIEDPRVLSDCGLSRQAPLETCPHRPQGTAGKQTPAPGSNTLDRHWEVPSDGDRVQIRNEIRAVKGRIPQRQRMALQKGKPT